jgi:tetratricopeptide (TPR) repeat protein
MDKLVRTLSAIYIAHALSACIVPTPDYSGKASEVSFDDELKDDVTLLDRKIARGERDESQKFYQSKISREPEVLRWQVLYAMSLEKDEDAEKLLSALVKKDPTIYYAYIGQGRIYEKWGTRDLAEAAYTKAIALNPRIEDAQLGMARVYRDQKRIDKSAEIYAQILVEHPRSYRAVYGQAQLALLQNDTVKARESFVKATQWYKEYYEAWFALATLDEKQGRLQDSKTELLKAIELRPKASEPVLLLARVNERLGLSAEAKLAYDRVTELMGTSSIQKDTKLVKEIALSKVKEAMLREDWDAALIAIKEAQDADPQDPSLYRMEADIYLGKENYSKALQAYEVALLTNPKDEAARAGRASVLTNLGAKEGPFKGNTEDEVLISVRTMVEGCYTTVQRQFPSLVGKFTFKVQVRSDGSVGQITYIEDTLKSPEVSACFEWGLRQGAFPAGGNRNVTTTWEFGGVTPTAPTEPIKPTKPIKPKK